ncbi:LysR substrate-binding domain-containing protein [Rahnella perminowiae]|uniref:LysR substrate-binding domain-containing protein n=1 Tax=Rahnella perminowiae TaxID=2816244 RepID=UPI00215C047C|nr:LysR substrate-binding domain-containing protein [Rahnella perminowiae]MCR8998630.1 LysR substrate-binding domain-containing protein [Rahnella perminowiae]
MSHNIPLSSLRTFIEVSRQGSMKLAAEKMCITTGAVSQQIRHLEEQMGIKLFSRHGKRLMLSIPGLSLRDAVARGFEEIENGWARIAPPVQNQLVISVVPVIAYRWLLPHLNSFQQQNPRISLSLRVCQPSEQLRMENADIWISLSTLSGEDLSSVPLWKSALIPVCHPALLNGMMISQPEDLLHYPLLKNINLSGWNEWFTLNDIKGEARSRGGCFDDEFGLINAALLQQGIALVHEHFVREELENGTLVQLFPDSQTRYSTCQFVHRQELIVTGWYKALWNG